MPYIAPSLIVVAVIVATIVICWHPTTVRNQDGAALATAVDNTKWTRTKPTPTYQAPWGNPDALPEHIIPDNYILYLAPEHSMEDVSRVIGIDLQPYVDNVLPMRHQDYSVAVCVKGVDESLLTAIRSDPGVKMVERNTKIYLAQ